MNRSNTELKRFIASGISSVIVDFLIYSLLIKSGLYLTVSKAISFSSGTLYSYFINKKWTFKATGGFKTFIKFIFVYSISLNINISVNNLIINFFLLRNSQTILIAFLVSTLLSAFFNFLCLKTYVFKIRK